MILIAHRGNINGKQPKNENTIEYIMTALRKGYDVEIDICKWDGKQWWLGHDIPQEAVTPKWLSTNPLWCHAKNYKAFQQLIEQNIHCFWHQTDKYTLTSRGYIWAYPGQPGGRNTIAVLPEIDNIDVSTFDGICSDFIERYNHD